MGPARLIHTLYVIYINIVNKNLNGPPKCVLEVRIGAHLTVTGQSEVVITAAIAHLSYGNSLLTLWHKNVYINTKQLLVFASKSIRPPLPLRYSFPASAMNGGKIIRSSAQTNFSRNIYKSQIAITVTKHVAGGLRAVKARRSDGCELAAKPNPANCVILGLAQLILTAPSQRHADVIG